MIENRIVFNLDKQWKFHFGDIDESKTGSHSTSYSKCKAGGVTGAGGMDFDDSSWREVDLPHDYLTDTDFNENNLISHGYKTRDNAWYRKTFRLDESLKGCQLMLDFEGIAVTAEIYLNGSLMGRSFSAYAPLAIDITDRAWFGDRLNTLAVRIDGLTTEGWWYEGAGIYRHVRLYAKNPVHIAHYGLFVKPLAPVKGCINSHPEADGSDIWQVECQTELENVSYISSSCRVAVELKYKDERVGYAESTCICLPDSNAVTMVTIPVKAPRIWDIDTPELYSASAYLVTEDGQKDSVSDIFGFRTIAADAEHGFIMNGKPLMLYGTCNHQDHAGVGVAVPDSIQYYRIQRLKDLGTNAYRCSHNMPTKEVLDACDRLGMVVMDENRRFETRPEVLAHAETMVKRDRNHPSVVMYSLFNEEPLQGNETGKRIYNRMKSRVVRLDNSRIITGAISGGYLDPDGCSDAMDVTGMNYRICDWGDFRRIFPSQPLIGAENNSAVTTRGCYVTDRSKNVLSGFDEEAVPWGQTIRETWDELKSHPYVGGIFIWTGFDYRGEPTPFEWPSISSQFGIMDTCGFPKDSFYINKAYFTTEPLVHIIGHWNHKKGEKIRIGGVTNQCATELFLNGESLGKKTPDTTKYKYNNITEWTVDFAPGELKLVAYDENGNITATDTAVTPGKPAKIVCEKSRDEIYTDGKDAVIINVHITDDAGNIIPDASDMIYFEASDALKLLGVGNGDPNCHESDHEPKRSLFAGYAQALFALENANEPAYVDVNADGLEGVRVEIAVTEKPGDAYIYASHNDVVDTFTVNKPSADMPDGTADIPDNDMNSFEKVNHGQGYIEGFKAGYVMYRARFKLSKAQIGIKNYFWFEGVRGETIDFFVDKKPVKHLDNAQDIKLNVEFTAEAEGDHELRIVVKGIGDNDSGIINKVSLRTDPGQDIKLTV